MRSPTIFSCVTDEGNSLHSKTRMKLLSFFIVSIEREAEFREMLDGSTPRSKMAAKRKRQDVFPTEIKV